MTFTGMVELDKSLFGLKIKGHRGHPNTGLHVWIVGLIERDTKHIILYPVENRTAETLVTVITKHVDKGSNIFSHCWASYRHLKDHGYEHFTVNHSTTFKQIYSNEETGEILEVHTNKIEGAWAHVKQHFK